ncbi:iron ABC transporter permease [Ochrovirga pacifica]|uniref:iron ABC transporter permease n=1 Tax=Ochrovirga pacifica TaxID=1042376 RepID=UPI000495B44B|nr:iron ABC transporter permease [Ochrovirga pacifica]
MNLTNKSYRSQLIAFTVLFCICVLLNLSVGSLSISLADFWNIISSNEQNTNLNYILFNYRMPKAIASILAGVGLGISGLLMQTYFRNPLAGPFVLGISSGASLGVAVLIMGSSLLGFSTFIFNYSLPLAASIGALFVLTTVMIASRNLKNTLSILIIGLMFGSFTSAIISVLSYFSSANELQQYIFWSLGSLGNLQWKEIYLLLALETICLLFLIKIAKPLDALLLGENYAKSMGVNLKKTQTSIFIITSVLTGCITAFMGPIAFVGLAIPHLTKLIFKNANHLVLMPAVGLIGAIVLLLCDTVSHIPINHKHLPINATTSLLGAPVVIWLLVSKSRQFL